MLRFKSPFTNISGTPISETWKQFLISQGSISVIVILLTAMIVRLTISFSHDLILGMDGGYYPVQV
jgi:hypothetical protein